MFNNTSTQVFTDTFKNILLTWNAQDPVSPREIARNNAIFKRQNNRNPYIDNNSYVAKIWGTPLGTSTYEIASKVSVFPNPTNSRAINIQSESSLDTIELITLNGQLIQQIKNPVLQNNLYKMDNLTQGFYFLKLSSRGLSITKKVIVN
jgi:hypothetical protein